MLQAIRDKAQGWIAWAIVILISIPFALWGIQEYLGVGDEPEVAVVDGEPITERMLDQRTRDFRENLRASLGNSYRADLFSESALKQQVLDAMVEERVLGGQAQDWNLRTSDAQARGFISAIPAFQRNGQFDQQSYDTLLRNRGMSRAGFEQSVRQDLSVGQMRAGVRDTVFVTETDLALRVSLEDEKRSFSYARIPAAAYVDQISTSDADLRKYYDANLDRYRTPEQVKLEYLVLDVADLTGLVELDDDRLRQYFEDHRAEFVAREERRLRHILVGVPAAASAEEKEQAQTKAADLLRQVQSGGTSFEELAREFSDDPGSAENGGDLGWVERGVMVPPFEEAAFALAKGETSGLVSTEFGIHIIQVTDVRGGAGGEFELVRDKVDAAYRKFEAENLYFDHAERLAEAAYENSASLTPAAEALGLRVQSTGWVTRDAVLQGLLGSPKVINAAFSDDVLVEGHNSELIEVAPQQAVVIRVAEHQPAGVKQFDEIKSQVADDYKRDKASEAAAETGKQTMAELESGNKALQGVASSNAWQLQEATEVTRDAVAVPAEVLVKAFSLQPPQDGKRRYGGVVSAEGDYVLIEVSAVQAGQLETLSDTQRPLRSEQAIGQSAAAQMRYFTQALRNRTEVELKPIATE